MKGTIRIVFGLLMLFGLAGGVAHDPTITIIEIVSWGSLSALILLWGVLASMLQDE